MSAALIVGLGSPLGGAIAVALTTEGHLVRGVSRSGRGGSEVVDIDDPEAARALLEDTRPDVVVYLARPELPTAATDRAVDAGVDTLRRFAVQCSEAGVERLLLASSAAVYGTAAATPRSEDDATPAPSPYAQLKLRSERALAEVSDASGLTAVSFRIFNVYGPGFSSSLVNRLVAASAGETPPTVVASDAFVRDYVHVDDVAAAFVAASARTPTSGVLNVGTGIGTSNTELLALVPGAPWLPAGELESPSVSIADVSRLGAALGAIPPPRLARLLSEEHFRT